MSQLDPGRHFQISPLGLLDNVDNDDVDERVIPLDLINVSDNEIVPESSPEIVPVGNVNFFPQTPEAVPETSIDTAEDDGEESSASELTDSAKENLEPANRSMVFSRDRSDHPFGYFSYVCNHDTLIRVWLGRDIRLSSYFNSSNVSVHT